MGTTARNAARAAATVNDPRWAAVIARDRAADGAFFYSVSSTGIYCRPSCAARLARPENVRFHATREDAERAGFRPCKRCRPEGPSQGERYAAQITAACRLIEQAESPPSLERLARHAGMSAFHFHRMFKRVTGLTPRQYGAARRAERVRDELGRRASITDAALEAGYGSSGRFYEDANAVLGMTPRAYRAGGVNMEIRYTFGACSLGSVLVAASDRGVCAIFLGDDRAALVRALEARFPRARVTGAERGFKTLVAKVVALIEAPGAAPDLPLDVRGTAFQQRVWQALRAIPPGSTASYAEIARRIGAPQAVRAVAGACASNALAVAIPCHRVVASDGRLAGYRWGLARKRALLARESTPSRGK